MRKAYLLVFAWGIALAAQAQPDPVVARREAQDLYARGVRLNNTDKFDQALPLLQRSVELYEQLEGPDHRTVYFALGPLSYSHYKLQNYKEALAIHERRLKMSLALFGEKHVEHILALRAVAIGHANLEDERYQLGLPLLERALRLAIEVLGEGNERTTHMLMVDVANAYSELGRNSEALELYERQARIKADKYGAEHEEAVRALSTVAIMYDKLGRTLEALPIYEKQVQMNLAKHGEAHRYTLFDMQRLGATYSELGRTEEGLRLLERTVALKPKVFHPKDREGIFFEESLAAAYLRAGRAKDALPLLMRAHELNAEDAGPRSAVALRTLAQIGRAHAALGDLGEARAVQRKVLETRAQVLGEQHADTVSALQDLAGTLEKMGLAGEALALYAKLVPAVEAMRASGDLSPEIRQALFAQWVGAYKTYARLLAAADPAASFRMAELSKARTLLESTAMRRANQSSVLAPAERDRVRALEEQISALSDRIAAAAGKPEERFRREADKNRAIAELGALRRDLGAKYPKYAQLSDVKIADAAQGTRVLPADAVLLSYLIDANTVVAFALSHEGLAAKVLPAMADLADKVAKYREIVSDPEKPGGEAAKLAAELGARLLDPLAAALAGKKRVIVSPDGSLALLPFEALPLGGKALIAHTDVSYAQSLSMLALMKEKDAEARPERRELLAMGGARYGGAPGSKRSVSLAKFVTRGGDVQKAFDLMNLQWEELPGSEKEIDAVAKVFAAGRAAVFRKGDATEEKLQQLNASGELARYRYLLFSAHGFLSTEEPALSALVLGQVGKAPGTDGYVTAGEWPAYTLASDLVVLSACDTGVGKVVQGEGVTGLPYALYVAGNRNTLLSLWPVVDESTARFMTAFFAKVAAGMPQAAALAATKREFIAGREFDRPLFWAPFVLYGD